MTFPSEHIEQREFVSWFRKNYKPVRIFAIPNGGLRNKTVAAKLKLEGVSSGVPDLFIPEWGVWIEFKRQRGAKSTVSKEQEDWMQYLSRDCGYRCVVAFGCDHAKELIEKFKKF